MNLYNEIQHLQELRDAGTLTEAEFAQAKSLALNSAAKAQAPDLPDPNFARLLLQNEGIQREQEWQQEREQFSMNGKYGIRYPSYGSGISMILAGIVLGAIFFAISVNADSPVPALMGFLLLPLTVAMGGSEIHKARLYQEAEERYRQEKQAIADRQKEFLIRR